MDDPAALTREPDREPEPIDVPAGPAPAGTEEQQNTASWSVQGRACSASRAGAAAG
ncbi:hypothetical protein [Kitasatospora sp. NPDC096140]|uniref:hypothetical protein n=1 Tax=Kitasatospora sp. NPDC096140 TaxID=3155425 RepID=UPI0033170975